MGFLKGNFGCGAVFCFIFMVGVVVSKVRLLTNPSVQAECGQTLTLKCEVNSTNPEDLTIKTLDWVHKNRSCDFSPAKADPGLNCQIQNATSPILLSGTLTDITLDDEGEYICKIRSNQGVVNEKTVVTVNCCFGSSEIIGNGSHLTCQFEGVYPSTTVQWLQGQNNLTNASTTVETKNKNGSYDYISTISIEKENQDQPYSCVLSWFSMCNNVMVERSLSDRGTVTVQQNTFVIAMSMLMMMTLMW